MNVEYLRVSAATLVQPSAEAAEAFEQHAAAMAEDLGRAMLARPDVGALIGEGNDEMMRDNGRNMMRFMGTMFRGYEPEVLVQTVAWVYRAYRARGFATLYWAAHLNVALDVLRNHVPEAARGEIEPFFAWLIVQIPAFTRLTDEEAWC